MNRGTELTASAVAERIIGGGEVTAEELVELLRRPQRTISSRRRIG